MQPTIDIYELPNGLPQLWINGQPIDHAGEISMEIDYPPIRSEVAGLTGFYLADPPTYTFSLTLPTRGYTYTTKEGHRYIHGY